MPGPISGWTWLLVPDGTPWDRLAWQKLNRSFRLLQSVLEALRSLATDRVTAADGEVTPKVTRVRGLLLENSAATAVTSLVGGQPGQTLTLFARDQHTTVTHGTLLRLNGNANWVTKRGETRQVWTDDGVTWYEVPRTIASSDP